MPSSRGRDLFGNLREHPAYARAIPLEAALSLPLPAVHRGKVYLYFFAYRVERPTSSEPQTSLTRVLARFCMDYETGRVVEYLDMGLELNRSYVSPARERQETPRTASEGLAARDIVAHEDRFFEVTDSILRLVGRMDLVPEEREVVKEYRRLVDLLIHPDVLSLFRGVSPHFWDWCDKAG